MNKADKVSMGKKLTSASSETFVDVMYTSGTSCRFLIRFLASILKMINLMRFLPLLVQICLVSCRNPCTTFRTDLFLSRIIGVSLHVLLSLSIPLTKAVLIKGTFYRWKFIIQYHFNWCLFRSIWSASSVWISNIEPCASRWKPGRSSSRL